MRARHVALLALLALAPAAASAGATITIVNGNAPGVGFNEATPAAPVGGNPGTTLGEQRLNAFRRAAEIWGMTLDSRVEIQVLATMEPLTCTPTSAVLGSAGPVTVHANFDGAGYEDRWYHQALANKRFGGDLSPNPDLRARFNSNLGQPNCLAGSPFYLGLDRSGPPGSIDLVAVLLHEFGHGLGFSSVTSATTGQFLGGATGFSDVYSKFYYDQATGKTRDEMTPAERVASAINPRNVVWTGPRVTSAVPGVLAAGTPVLSVAAPATVAGDYAVGAASFGPPLASPGVTGQIVVALDGANASGPSTIDACTAITNPADVAGKIALVQRGTCGFVVKVKNAQDAGAIAVVVVDNVAGGPPAGLGGADPTITIPSVRITLADGQKLLPALPVTATLGLDLGVRAGASRAGFAMLYTPNPLQSGSSVSHWDTSTFPNQLMEPAINPDLTHSVAPPEDLTLPMFRDIGWYLDRDLDFVDDEGADQCLGSDLRPTVIVGGVDTGVANEFFTDGCTIVDRVNACAAAAAAHGDYVSCASAWTNTLKAAGVLTGAQKAAIQRAVAQDRNP